MKILIGILEHPYRILIYFLLILIFSINFVNCYKMEVENRVPDYPVKKCLEYDSKKTIDNVCMALLPIQGENEVDKYFGHSIYSANILPILIVTENNNKDSSFILPTDEPKIYLFKLDEKIKEPPTENSSGTTVNIDAKKSIYEYGDIEWKEGKGERIARGFIGGLATGFTAIILESFNVDPGEEIHTSAYSVTRKSLRRETLSPFETESGFIFTKLPKEIDNNHRLFVNISAMNMNSGKKIKFDFIENLKK